MADNTHQYGFRWVGSLYGGAHPPIVRRGVSTGEAFVDDDGTSINLNIGDPVKLVSDGDVDYCQDGEAVYGIVAGIAPYWDGEVMKPGKFLPDQTAWGTVEERRSYVYVIPAVGQLFEIDCNDNTTATTRAAYHAFIGENCDHFASGDATDSTKGDVMLDISTHATTAAQWRIHNISDSAFNEDFSGNYVKLIVTVNESSQTGVGTTTGT